MRRDYLWEGMWVALGAALGVAPNCVAILYNTYWTNHSISMSIIDLCQVIIFFISVSIFTLLGYIMWNKATDCRDLVSEIRGGKSVGEWI